MARHKCRRISCYLQPVAKKAAADGLLSLVQNIANAYLANMHQAVRLARRGLAARRLVTA